MHSSKDVVHHSPSPFYFNSLVQQSCLPHIAELLQCVEDIYNGVGNPRFRPSDTYSREVQRAVESFSGRSLGTLRSSRSPLRVYQEAQGFLRWMEEVMPVLAGRDDDAPLETSELTLVRWLAVVLKEFPAQESRGFRKLLRYGRLQKLLMLWLQSLHARQRLHHGACAVRGMIRPGLFHGRLLWKTREGASIMRGTAALLLLGGKGPCQMFLGVAREANVTTHIQLPSAVLAFAVAESFMKKYQALCL